MAGRGKWRGEGFCTSNGCNLWYVLCSILVVRTLQQLAEDEKIYFPRTFQILKNNFYIDALISGCENGEEAVAIYQELKGLLSAGGFDLCKWTSNDMNFIEAIPDYLQPL